MPSEGIIAGGVVLDEYNCIKFTFIQIVIYILSVFAFGFFSKQLRRKLVP